MNTPLLAIAALFSHSLLLQADPTPDQDQKKLKQLEGHVIATDRDWKFAIVNLGSVHGVGDNTEFIISRRGKQIASLRADQVEPTQTVTKLDPKEEVQIQPGDTAVAVGVYVPQPRVATRPMILIPFRGLGFVTVAGGRNNGIAKGDTAEVVRDGKVIAKLVVTTVESNVSAADIIPGSLEEGRLLQRGDTIRPEGERQWEFKAKFPSKETTTPKTPESQNKMWDSMPSSASCLAQGLQVSAGFQAASSPF